MGQQACTAHLGGGCKCELAAGGHHGAAQHVEAFSPAGDATEITISVTNSPELCGGSRVSCSGLDATSRVYVLLEQSTTPKPLVGLTAADVSPSCCELSSNSILFM
mmetsp:Transcript_154875/g.288820  ORF Transcript_154875/g.288820 Transcript_154875/m.288820 type:complete len:106 (+) Transcript_154875:2093-2410(+)